eukprot:11347361-Karenia_brevis.AAC.1
MEDGTKIKIVNMPQANRSTISILKYQKKDMNAGKQLGMTSELTAGSLSKATTIMVDIAKKIVAGDMDLTKEAIFKQRDECSKKEDLLQSSMLRRHLTLRSQLKPVRKW